MFDMHSTYYLKLTVRLRIQFVSVSPLNVRLDQTCTLGLKVWGSKHFWGIKTSVFVIKIFNGKTKFEGD